MKRWYLFIAFWVSFCIEKPVYALASITDKEVYSLRALNSASQFVPDSSVVTQYKKIISQLIANSTQKAKVAIGQVGVFGLHSLLHEIEQPMNSDRLQAENDLFEQIERVIALHNLEVGLEDPLAHHLKDIFLLKATVLLVENMIAESLSVLDLLAVSYNYWIGLQGRPWFYFFHKSPHKWFLKKNQDDEIREKIKFVMEYKKKYHLFLGRFVQYICMFDPAMLNESENNSDATRVWVRGLIDIVRESIFSLPKRSEDSLSYGTLLKDIYSIFTQVNKLQDSLQEDIYKQHAQKPGHITRNWLWYVGASSLLYWVVTNYKNDGVVKQNIMNLYKLYQDREVLFRDYVKLPFERFWDVLSKRRTDEQTSGQQSQNKKLTGDALKELYATPEKYKELEKLYAHLNEKTVGFKTIMGVNFAYLGHDFMLNKLVADLNVLFITDVVAPFLNDTEKNYLMKVNAVEKRIEEVLESQRMNLALMSFIPVIMAVGASLYGTKALYKKVTKVNYTPLRLALCDVEDILIRLKLNEYNQELYGELLHKLHELRVKAQYMIPRVDGMRVQFMRQIYLLESVQFSSDDKRAVIYSLRERYSFLRSS